MGKLMNTCANFTSQLKTPITVSANAKVAIAAISFPNNIENVTDILSNHPIIIRSRNMLESDVSYLHVEKGCYKSNEEFIEMLNSKNPAKSYFKFYYGDYFCKIKCIT